MAAPLVVLTVLFAVDRAQAHLAPLTWEKLPLAYPIGAVEEAQGGMAGGKLYLFGGYNTTGAKTGTLAGPLNPLPYAFALNPDTNSFQPIAPLSSAGIEQPFTHAGTTTDGRYFYFVGGVVLKNPAYPAKGIVDGSRRVYATTPSPTPTAACPTCPSRVLPAAPSCCPNAASCTSSAVPTPTRR
jgi:hypothetical protein